MPNGNSNDFEEITLAIGLLGGVLAQLLHSIESHCCLNKLL
jgi:hypothetical protein